MKVPMRWVADYVDLDVSHDSMERLARRLTLAGLEVEEAEETGPLARVVVGRVTAVRPHPNADKLVLCTVDTQGRSVEVVCGASNVVENALVPLALVGASLPIGLAIEKRDVRGVVSDGMICSKEELRLEETSEGIWILDPALGLNPGDDLAEHLEFDDVIFDFKVASNRPDCASVYGVAREVAAVLDLPLKPLAIELDEADEPAADAVRIVIENPDDTPRYAARVMDGIKISPAPLRMQHRLLKAGMRPLSNVVDATNYVMLELGQPLHPFDADDIGAVITIRRAKDGEVFRTLDGVDRTLSPEALMITDENGGIALAGMMGGERGEIESTTDRLLLEIASFNSYSVRQSSRSVGLRTEASQRFERGLDPDGVGLAADRAAHWIQRLTGCRLLKGLADAYPKPSEPRSIRLRPPRVGGLLGIEVPAEEMVDILRRLDIEASAADGEIVARIPSFRPDLEREVDLIEEIGRIYGYDRFPSAAPRMQLRVGRKERIELGKDRIREALVGQGLYEVLTDGFDRTGWREALGRTEEELVRVRNPMAATQNALRVSLLPGILGVVETNLNVGVDGGMVFELGRVFTMSAGERESLAGAVFGRTRRPLAGKETVDLSLGKGILEGLFRALRLDGVTVEQGESGGFLHPGRSARFLLDGRRIGVLGELAPALADRLSVRTPVLLFEFDASDLLGRFQDVTEFAELPSLPASKRDLSLTAPLGLAEGAIREAIRAEPSLESILLYDLYEGEQVGQGRKSLTYEVTFRAPDRTLTDEDVSESMSRIESRLRNLDVHLRAG
jgi:phenylalanyl-tRNA synthetase beta chain